MSTIKVVSESLGATSHSAVIIPAFNEENGVELVIRDIPKELVREIIVCNNASTDLTAEKARLAGATVVEQQQKGYGNACLAGIISDMTMP